MSFLKHRVRKGKDNGKAPTEMGPKTKRNKYRGGSSFGSIIIISKKKHNLWR
jgi:hypothetical protein